MLPTYEVKEVRAVILRVVEAGITLFLVGFSRLGAHDLGGLRHEGVNLKPRLFQGVLLCEGLQCLLVLLGFLEPFILEKRFSAGHPILSFENRAFELLYIGP